jgi:pSer/pThr/pTyr-binding forkhead associated (FHA) protein
VISCSKCTKDNQDHYKFCLGCGAELPRDASPKKFSPGTPPQGMSAASAPKAAPVAVVKDPWKVSDEHTTEGTGPFGAAAVASAAAAVVPRPAVAARPAVVAQPVAAPTAAEGAVVACPQCAHPNPPNNKFCATCGFKLAAPAIAAPSAAPAPAPAGASSVILTALRADGSEAGKFTLTEATTTVGRDTGSVFQGDSYLSPRHATFIQRGAKLFVRDEGSLNGVYRKLQRDVPVAIQYGDVFRIGQELLRLDPLKPEPPSPDGVERMGSPATGYVGRVALIVGRDATGNAYPVPETGLHFGRERGDVLFPEDGYVSGLHCTLSYEGGKFTLVDLGSSNGSFIRITNEIEVLPGDILLMGQQLFRIGA